MRGDRVGVGDIGEVSGRTRDKRHPTRGDDGRGSGGKRNTGLVGGHGRIEHDASGQPSRDRIGIGDGARGKSGTRCVHGQDASRADGMRGDGVGVGDVGEVSGGTRVTRHSPSGDDGRGSIRQRITGLDGRYSRTEHDS